MDLRLDNFLKRVKALADKEKFNLSTTDWNWFHNYYEDDDNYFFSTISSERAWKLYKEGLTKPK